MIKPQKERGKKRKSVGVFSNHWKVCNDPHKKLQVSFSCQDRAITTRVASSQRNKSTVDVDRAWFMVWGSYSYSIIQVLRTHLLTCSYLLIQDASWVTQFTFITLSLNLQIQKCRFSTTSCNSDYLNYLTSEETLNYKTTSPKTLLASGQILLHLQQPNSEQVLTEGFTSA